MDKVTPSSGTETKTSLTQNYTSININTYNKAGDISEECLMVNMNGSVSAAANFGWGVAM